MNAWGKDLGLKKITLLPDGSGSITRQLGMLVDKPAQNFGQRSWRYSSYIVNGIVKKMFIEPGINNTSADEDPYEESTPEKILDYVKSL
jgi:peroxiredoxin